MPERPPHPFWTLHGLEKASGGQWLSEPDHPDTVVTDLIHDSRDIYPGCAYLAIRGERHDGHDFVADAFKQGAAMAIVAEDANLRGLPGPCLAVRCPIATLQQLARVWRHHLHEAGCHVLAVVGSNGKTTVRHLTHHVLSHAGLHGSQSPKSFNNHLGLPLTLLAAHHNQDYVACELGTNHPGEIDMLGSICRPDSAVITSIGEEHLQYFGDLAGVAREEASVSRHIRENGVLWVSAQASEHTLPFEALADGISRVIAEDHPAIPADLALPGAHGRSNAALAAHVATHLGANPERITDALRQARTPEGRWQHMPCRQGHIIHDAYNANPSSLTLALDSLANMPVKEDGRRVVVLGDMHELGDTAPAAHDEGVSRALSLGFTLICIGPLCQAAAERAGLPAHRIGGSWHDATRGWTASQIHPHDTVLLKASRGQRLERLIEPLAGRLGGLTSTASN